MKVDPHQIIVPDNQIYGPNFLAMEILSKNLVLFVDVLDMMN